MKKKRETGKEIQGSYRKREKEKKEKDEKKG